MYTVFYTNLSYIDGKMYNGNRLQNISVQCCIKIFSIVLHCKLLLITSASQYHGIVKFLGMKLRGKSYIAAQYLHMNVHPVLIICDTEGIQYEVYRNNFSNFEVTVFLGCGST